MYIVNLDRLLDTIKEKGTSIPALAKHLNIDKSTLYRKLQNNGEGLTIKDIHGLCEGLNLTADEAMNIFFKHRVA